MNHLTRIIPYLVLATVVGCQAPRQVTPPVTVPAPPAPPRAALVPWAAHDYSYLTWVNGWRKPDTDPAADLLGFETGQYRLFLDLAALDRPRLGRLEPETGWLDTLAAGTDSLRDTPPAELNVTLEQGGKTYRLVTCGAHGQLPRQSARIWEWGQLAQHVDLRNLIFEDDAGARLGCRGSLDLMIWPGTLTLNLELAPDHHYTQGPSPGIAGRGVCVLDQPVDIPHDETNDPETLTVECWVKIPEAIPHTRHGWFLCKNENEWDDGNFGFGFAGWAPTAIMNIGGDRENVRSIPMHAGDYRRHDWNHLALTYDGDTMRAYLNGKLQGSETIGQPRVPKPGVLRLGKRGDDLFSLVAGLYDQVRIWDRALSEEELLVHAERPAELPSREGLVLEENFESGDAAASFVPPVWTNATVRLGLKTAADQWQTERTVDGAWEMDQSTGLTLNCDLGGGDQAKRKVTVRLATPAGQTFPVRFDPAKNCYRAEVTDLQRSFAGGYVKITDYDEFDLEIDCAETAPAPLPLDFHLPDPANITGLVPILCHPDGTPTGIPVQLSKNWHHGSYLRAYALVPLQPGLNRYRLRIVYGFYGTLPSASHAQLSLIGYGGNQRWDQLALGSGGEAITFDVDMSLTEVAICDVRLPLGQQGIDGNPWGWTDAGWGGDWLGVFDNNGKKLALAGIKTAYGAQGPCLSEVAYRGAYGSARPVLLEARVQLPRTDDYGRTFQKLTYRFRAPLEATNSWFMSKSYYAAGADEADSGQEIAYGNVNGLIATCPVPAEPEAGDRLIPPTELHGPGPWWVTFPNHDPAHTGYIAMVVRDYRAVLDGRTYENPFLEVRVAGQRRGSATLKANIVPPPQVTAYQPGDVVELDTQWLHLVRTAEDYGGANAAYRRHLEKYPRSWKTTYREVVGNKLRVTVSGGTLRSQYPIIIEPRRPEVKVTIRGGIGHVPIRFEGLDAADGYAVYEQTDGGLVKLDQAVHGNDYWQTDYDPATALYQLTFNLPVDGKKTSHWIFKR